MEELRNIYQEDIHYFVQHGSSLLKKLHKTRTSSQNSEQVSWQARTKRVRRVVSLSDTWRAIVRDNRAFDGVLCFVCCNLPPHLDIFFVFSCLFFVFFHQVPKLEQYVKEGQNALLYINRCHDTDHVPSAASLHSLEHTLIRVHKASNVLQVI